MKKVLTKMTTAKPKLTAKKIEVIKNKSLYIYDAPHIQKQIESDKDENVKKYCFGRLPKKDKKQQKAS